MIFVENVDDISTLDSSYTSFTVKVKKVRDNFEIAVFSHSLLIKQCLNLEFKRTVKKRSHFESAGWTVAH